MSRLINIVLSVIFILGVVLAGCNSTPVVAKNGDTVQVNYTGKLADGTIFDSSVGRDPLEFTLGKGDVITGFDKAVLGMKVGEKKTVTVPATEAYGPHHDGMVMEINKDELPADIEPKVGQILETTMQNGQKVQFAVTNISDNGTITLDANHPLAGKVLTFDIELLKIE